MSFIRPTSSPDGLYIYHSIENTVSVHARDVYVKGKKKKSEFPDIKYKQFLKLCQKCKKANSYLRTPITVGELSLEAVEVNKRDMPGFGKYGVDTQMYMCDHRIKLSNGTHSILMYCVTWAYIMNNVLSSEDFYREKKRKK